MPGSAPSCTFEVFAQGFRTLSLAVNGKGQVAGSMQVDVLVGLARVGDISVQAVTGAQTFTEGAPPACGPALLRCASVSSVEESPTETRLIMVLDAGDTASLVRVTCTGGGLASAESVSAR